MKARKSFFESMRGQAGFTLVEALAAMAVLSISTAAMITQVGNAKQLRLKGKAIAAMTSASQSLSEYVASRGTLVWSATKPGNQALANCLNGGACRNDPADPNDPNAWHPFDLYVPGEDNRAAGRESNPQKYTSGGEFCTDGGAVPCSYQATVEFSSRCPQNKTTCTTAQYILVRYKIGPTDNSMLWPEGAAKPRPLVFTYEIANNFQGVWKRLDVSCGAGQALRGVNISLKPLCVALPSPQPGDPGPQGVGGIAGDQGPKGYTKGW